MAIGIHSQAGSRLHRSRNEQETRKRLQDGRMRNGVSRLFLTTLFSWKTEVENPCLLSVSVCPGTIRASSVTAP